MYVNLLRLCQECSTWLNIAAAQEESGCPFEDVDSSYSEASRCAQESGQARLQVRWNEPSRGKLKMNSKWSLVCPPLQRRVMRTWLATQRRFGSSKADDTEARLQELCAAQGCYPEESDGEEEMDNSEPLDDSDVVLSDSGKQSTSNGKLVACRPYKL